MLRVALVLRSTEVHPVFFDLFPLASPSTLGFSLANFYWAKVFIGQSDITLSFGPMTWRRE